MKAGKGLFKGVINSVVKGPLNLVKGILKGKFSNIFKLGAGLLGGLVGGPVGSFLLGQIAQKGRLPKGKELLNGIAQQFDPRKQVAMKFPQAFGQVHDMLNVVNNYGKSVSDVQRNVIAQMIRV